MMSTQRPPSGVFGGMRPPSGIGGMRANSSAGFGAPGSRGGTMAGVGTALNTNFEVPFRPVTKEGMQVNTMTAGGLGRKVADRSYYLGLLRSKNSELQAEIQRLKAQEEQLLKNSSAMQSMEHKTKQLSQDVQQIKESLADYNFAVSKAQAGVEVDTMKADIDQLTEQNAVQSKRADAIFLEVKELELKAKEVETVIKRQLEEMDQKLNAEPEKRAQYYALRQQSSKLQEEMVPKQNEFEKLQRKLQSLNNELRADSQKQAALKLQEKRIFLEKKKLDMLKEINETGSLPDEKSKLLNQVKTDNLEIEGMQAKIEELKRDCQKVKETISHVETDLSEYKGDRAEKYKELELKDKEMQEFIDRYPETKKESLSLIAKTEDSIVHRLELIGRGIAASENLPSPAEVEEMAASLDFKKKQMELSMTTHERLRTELELRRKELEKVDSLDSKISGELEAITEKIHQNEEATRKYSNLEALRSDSDQKKRDLLVQKNRYLRLRDSLKQLYTLTVNKYEPLRVALQENESHLALSGLEQKIKHAQQQVFSMTDFIAQKGSEADYMALKVMCIQMTEDINKFVQDQSSPK